MYSPKEYAGLSEEEIKKRISKEGYDPLKISNPPGFMYQPHQHPVTKLIVVLKGSMQVSAEGNFDLNQGDRLEIPGEVMHSAVVGEDGCTFLWGETLSKEEEII